jgi:ketosteroid isomerase-like protein
LRPGRHRTRNREGTRFCFLLIIERITGRSWRRAVTRRVIRPLRLTGTDLPAQSQQVVVRAGVEEARPGREHRRLRGRQIEELGNLPHLCGITGDLLVEGGGVPFRDPAAIAEQHAHRDVGRGREAADDVRGQHFRKPGVEGQPAALGQLQHHDRDEWLRDAPARNRSARRIGTSGVTEEVRHGDPRRSLRAVPLPLWTSTGSTADLRAECSSPHGSGSSCSRLAEWAHVLGERRGHPPGLRSQAQGDFWAAGEVFDPEIVWEWSASLSGVTGTATYHGIQGVEAATRDFFKAWDWYRQEAEELIEVGDGVLVITRTHARMKGSEREVEGNAAELWTFRAGKVIHHKSYDSPAEALEAAGLADRQAAD